MRFCLPVVRSYPEGCQNPDSALDLRNAHGAGGSTAGCGPSGIGSRAEALPRPGATVRPAGTAPRSTVGAIWGMAWGPEGATRETGSPSRCAAPPSLMGR